MSPSWARAGAAGVATMLLLAGCTGVRSTDQGSAAVVEQAVGDASSAVEVGAMVVDLLRSDRTTTAVADTTLRDASAGAWEAQGLLSREVPSGAKDAALRDRAMVAADAGAAALADARAWVNGTSGTDAEQVAQALSDAADALDSVDAEVDG